MGESGERKGGDSGEGSEEEDDEEGGEFIIDLLNRRIDRMRRLQKEGDEVPGERGDQTFEPGEEAELADVDHFHPENRARAGGSARRAAAGAGAGHEEDLP